MKTIVNAYFWLLRAVIAVLLAAMVVLVFGNVVLRYGCMIGNRVRIWSNTVIDAYAEIGDALGCSETTARVHVNRACKKLSRLLGHMAAAQSASGDASYNPLHSTESTK